MSNDKLGTFALATGNVGKIAEMTEFLMNFGITTITTTALQSELPEETGDTYEENAILKAKAVAETSGFWTIADDSGIEVEALNNAPGVRSARYAGEDATSEQNNQRLLSELGKCDDQKGRRARFQCVIALALPSGLTHLCRGEWAGVIASEPQGSQGFGYDPIFIPNGQTETAAMMSSHQKLQHSHRGEALRELAELLGHYRK